MRHGDIVRIDGRKAVALRVTRKMIQAGLVDVSKPGTYAFAGYWYGKQPMDTRSYGKILNKDGRKAITIGRVRTHFEIKNFHQL